MLKAFKYRLYPTKEQQEYFSKCFGCVRFLYNQMLANRIELYEAYKHDKELLKANKPRTYTSFKKDFPFLKEVDNLALANAQLNLNKAYKKYFKEGSGFPKFKSKKRSRKSYTTNNQGGNIRIEGNAIKLPKIGFVKVRQHRLFDGLIKSCTISQTPTGKYYVSVLVEMEDVEWIPAKNKIGIDLGLTDFAVTTNDDGISEKHPNPRHLRKAEKQLKKAQRALSRKKIGSRNREKARLALAKKHEKVANQRKDFLHKLTDRITSENQVIVIETLKTSNLLKNRKLSKSIADAGWHEFIRQLEYKSAWRGRTVIKADQWYASTQLCSHCGSNGGKKPLDVRTWICAECGTVHDRDINASRNLLKLAN
ncbi:IS200/IS605 family element RNA-guided endonuclease TnpB [Heyndrickxia sporothermodurans]|uniref:IS200/IS605 family element RNA-guided endonuclease TnpB n=1 Tax=Heyndrickxia sporothermodurans TaxID=46224 RepID=UPI002DBA0E95|nr:IS200/IS605 family element RNA-guided endonuclease TnpB [Heyndrickxia sporothermodurans]MEB6549737.1 IS200/IS605 family element RNA-guided endonuclease TnpB [Heyndrickxia sporothermodurans]